MSNKVSLLALIIAIAALAVVVLRPAADQSAQKETTFERVMRTGTIRCGYGIWVPELMKDPNTGALSGHDYDVMNAVGRVLSLKVEWTEESGWGVAEQGILNKRYDMFCNGLWPSPTRTRIAAYSRPFMYTPVYSFVSAQKNFNENDLSWINKPETTVATIPNAAIDTLVDFKFPKVKKFQLSDLASDGEFNMAVANGKADVSFSNYASLKKYMDANPGQIRISDKPAVYMPGGFLLPPDDYRLKHMIDFAITYLLETGVIRDILQKDLPDSAHDWRYPAAEHEP